MAVRVHVRVKVDHAQARAHAREVAERKVTQTTRRVQNRAKVTSPVDTGLMRASHVAFVAWHGSRIIGEVRVTVPYAAAVHDGWRRIEPIRPVHAKALRFKIHGKVIYAKAVYAPASYGGRPWLWEALVEIAGPEGYELRRVPH
jgi:hypothetical protein